MNPPTDKRRMLIILGASAGVLAAAFLIWLFAALRPADPDSSEVSTYTLRSGVGSSELAEDLSDKGLIRSASAFNAYITLTGMRGQLQAGSYDLSPADSARDIANKIAAGHVAANRLVVPEGTTINKLKEIAEQRGVKPEELDEALKAEYPHDFVKARPKGVSLEGYLFPDSYDLVRPVRAKALVQQMLDNFAKKVSGTDYAQKFAAQGMNLHQGITLASIVEREVKSDEDRALVAQLYINRLKAGMPLQADPTTQYAAELMGKPFDLRLDSPYNTYAYRGLPPGPIANPGLSAMKAVAYPKANDYLYFLSGKDGKTHFAKTLQEHERNIKLYLE